MKPKKNHVLIKHLVGVALSVGILAFITSYFPVEDSIMKLGLAGPLGALFAGMLFVSSFTILLGTFFIAALADAMPLWQLVFFAGFGSTIVDVFLFHLVRHTVFEEMKPLMRKWRRRHFVRILRSRYVSWTVPVLGALIIISPLPDEIGVGMMGISNLNTKRFAMISFVLNCIGVLLVAVAARAII